VMGTDCGPQALRRSGSDTTGESRRPRRSTLLARCDQLSQLHLQAVHRLPTCANSGTSSAVSDTTA
jgi:hypothetical protein